MESRGRSELFCQEIVPLLQNLNHILILYEVVLTVYCRTGVFEANSTLCDNFMGRYVLIGDVQSPGQEFRDKRFSSSYDNSITIKI